MKAITKIFLGVVGFFLLLGIIVVVFGIGDPKPVTEFKSSFANSIFYDAKWYQVLYFRYTVTDWTLGLLAAGTAIATALKNAVTVNEQKKAEAKAIADKTDVPPSPGFDTAILWLAALTIVATTLDAKIRPATVAERYRQGDLLLQDAMMDYRNSDKTPADDKVLLASWHQAQRILEGAPAVPVPASRTPDRPEAPVNPASAQNPKAPPSH